MQLPFSREAFFDVFAVYNNALWPFVLALWAATLLALIARVAGRDRSEWTFGLLAVQWAWSAVAYHASLFSAINPAAWGFAALFLVQAALLTWFGVVHHRLRFSEATPVAHIAGYVLIVYGLFYPLLAVVDGHAYPRVPTFGVPCPTTIVTVGFLLLVRGRLPFALVVVPVLWAALAGSSAFLLDVHTDLMLLVAGAALLVRAWPTTMPVAATR